MQRREKPNQRAVSLAQARATVMEAAQYETLITMDPDQLGEGFAGPPDEASWASGKKDPALKEPPSSSLL